MEHETQICSENAVHLARHCAHDHFFLVVAEVDIHNFTVKLSFVAQGPLADRNVDLLDLAVAATNEKVVRSQSSGMDTI